MVSYVVASITSVIATYIFLRLLQAYTHGPSEPPVLADEIPFLSPLIGLAKQSRFYTDMRDGHDVPIYTLRLPGSRIYVINSLKLIAAAQHQVRVLDFAPVEVGVVTNAMGATAAGQEILNMNRNGVGKHSYAIEFSKAIHPAISPGANLDAINRASVQLVSDFLDRLADETPKTIRLFDWVRKEVALATSDAVYGPQNPFQDSAVLAAFWYTLYAWRFEPGIVIMLLKLFPSVLAKDSLVAREQLVKAFEKYFAAGGHEHGSALIHARYQHSIDYGVGPEDMARFEIGGVFAVLTNTIPTAFWVLWHILAVPSALAACRAELDRVCETDGATVTLDITAVKHGCPLLVSTLQETLRFHGTGTSVRIVQRDHLLDGQYLLKKGATVMIPGPVQHTSPAIYGQNVGEFDHARFVRAPGKPRLNPAGFRGFGGGSTLCPGRHFVSTEIIAFVALAILRFDFAPTSGKWVRPTTRKAGMQATIPPPDADVEVDVTARKGQWAGQKWNVVLNGSDKALGLVVEDAVHGEGGDEVGSV